MPYIHPTGTKINAFNSYDEHIFYEETTKRQMFLIIEQLTKQINGDGDGWVDSAKAERELLKVNGIK